MTPQFAGTPTNSVSLYDGTVLLGQVSLTNGAATFNTLALTAGTHNFSAVYAGDANFTKSTSNPAQLTVPPATPVQFKLLSTKLVYSETPAFETDIAVVRGKAPTGTITIYDTVKNITTKVAAYPLYAITKGVVVGLVLPSLNVGQHSLLASYSGDANYPLGQSAAIAVTVTPGPVKLTLQCTSTQLKIGQTLSCSISSTITCKPLSGTSTLTVSYAAQGNYQAATPVSVPFTVK